MRVPERVPMKGNVFVLQFDARLVRTYDDYLSIVGKRKRLTEQLCLELAKERSAVEWRQNHNLFTTLGLNALANVAAGSSSMLNSYCGVGSSNAAPTVNDTDLGAPISPRVILTGAYNTANVAVFDTFIPASGNAGTWQETGMFTVQTAGTMYNHALLSSSLTKTTSNTDVVEHQWTL